jgi:hypothetical protein
MEAALSSEALTPIYQTTWYHIPKDTIIYGQCSESHKFHTLLPSSQIFMKFNVYRLPLKSNGKECEYSVQEMRSRFQ